MRFLDTSFVSFRHFLLIVTGILIISALPGVVRVYVDPPVNIMNYLDELTVSVKVEGITEPMRGFEMGLSFDTNYLSVSDTTAFQEGSFLNAAGPTQWYCIGANGNYTITCAILGVTPGSTGSGTLFTVSLNSGSLPTGLSGTNISLANVVMRGVLNNEIPVEVLEGGNVVIQTQDYIIPLSLGWNLVSSPVVPFYNSIDAVFSELVSAGYLVKVQDETGNAFEQSVQGNWINDIGTFVMSEGYYVKVNTACNLVMRGEFLTLPLTINLQLGWNTISYPYLTPQNAMTILQPLINANVLVKVLDESSATILKNGLGVWVNNIGNFETGEGYYINVNANCQITYQQQ
jgi:hypothetical protein